MHDQHIDFNTILIFIASFIPSFSEQAKLVQPISVVLVQNFIPFIWSFIYVSERTIRNYFLRVFNYLTVYFLQFYKHSTLLSYQV